MKRALPVLIVTAVLLAFVGTLVFLWSQSREEEVVFETTTPFFTDIVKKTVATGAIVPRNEVAIKPRVSGIIDAIEVEPGAEVERGDLLATIRIIPDAATASRSEASVRSAKISLDDARAQRSRAEELAASGAISRAELDRARVAAQLAEQDYLAAAENLRIVREGASAGSADVSTEVRATVAGMVLDVPVREGESVIEANTFNAGTTIATLANMDDMIFEGKVDESEVGKIREGLDLKLTVGALQDRELKGVLEYIAPKGALEQGAVQFAIKAAILPVDDLFIRAGSSANADIVLESRQEVLSIPESVLQFEGETPYVEVEVAEQVFERRDVQVGLSDGINIEVIGGLGEEVKIKRHGG
jgi:HlyD family secretion protein